MPEIEKLSDRLRATTQEMATQASVPMELWDRHSNAVLEAANLLDAARPSPDGEAGWRDIESAPVNQRILVIGKSRVPYILYKWHEDGFMANWRYGSGPESGTQAGWDWAHWRPLPAPPTTRGETK